MLHFASKGGYYSIEHNYTEDCKQPSSVGGSGYCGHSCVHMHITLRLLQHLQDIYIIK